MCHSHTETPGRIHSHFSTDADNNQGQANYIECHPHIITDIDPVHVQNRLATDDGLKRHNEPHQFSTISISAAAATHARIISTSRLHESWHKQTRQLWAECGCSDSATPPHPAFSLPPHSFTGNACWTESFTTTSRRTRSWWCWPPITYRTCPTSSRPRPRGKSRGWTTG